jgi:hypothetical protein
MSDLFFENVETKNRYKVVSIDEEAGTITLIGRHNKPFPVKWDVELFKKLGYRPVKGDAVAPPPPPSSPVPPPPTA